ncbi:MAG: hypothetical protein Rubg2KO_12390 [Rubricoccaceae bacterium]
MRVLTLLLVLLLAACTPSAPLERPADFSIEYRSSPPIYPEAFYTIVSIDPNGEGRIEVEMMMPHQTETRIDWARTFQLDDQSHNALYEVLREDLFGVRYPEPNASSIPAGAGAFTLTATAASTTAHVPEYATESRRRKPRRLDDAVRAAVPGALWDELETVRERARPE